MSRVNDCWLGAWQGLLPAATALAANGWYLSPFRRQSMLTPLAVRHALQPSVSEVPSPEGATLAPFLIDELCFWPGFLQVD